MTTDEYDLDSMDREQLISLVKTLDYLSDQRDMLLAAIPECQAHGACVPHALDWIKVQKEGVGIEVHSDALVLLDMLSEKLQRMQMHTVSNEYTVFDVCSRAVGSIAKVVIDHQQVELGVDLKTLVGSPGLMARLREGQRADLFVEVDDGAAP